jgi:hypothetical protein
MGASCDNFIKYPHTPHLFGSRGTDDDKHLGRKASAAFIADPSLIVEEKLDGTNVGIHFTQTNRMVLQCRGHEIREGMHPQYDLFKQWTSVKRPTLEALLSDRFILYGEWLYAKHSVHYRALPHYFFEFDIYDKEAGQFLDLAKRLEMLEPAGLQTVPVIHDLFEKEKPENEVISLSWLVSNLLLYLFALADTRGRKAGDTGRPDERIMFASPSRGLRGGRHEKPTCPVTMPRFFEWRLSKQRG